MDYNTHNSNTQANNTTLTSFNCDSMDFSFCSNTIIFWTSNCVCSLQEKRTKHDISITWQVDVCLGKAIDGWKACAFILFQHKGLPGIPVYCWWIYLSNTHSLIINASSRSVCLPHIIARYNINHWATDTTLYNMAHTKAPWVIHYSYQLQWIPHEMGLVSCVNAQTSSDPKSYSLNWYITLLAGKDSSV